MSGDGSRLTVGLTPALYTTHSKEDIVCSTHGLFGRRAVCNSTLLDFGLVWRLLV